jgi:hypothetical protein
VIFGSTSILGLAVADRSIACAQLSTSSNKRVVRHIATFALPAELTFEQPAALGQALASFLRSHGFSATRAVVGVPAKWLIAHEKDVPPTDPQSLRALLRLHVERAGAVETGEMIFDYARDDDAGLREGGQVLMVGILRRQLDRIEQTMDAAGLTVVAVTPSSLALSTALAEDGVDAEASMLVLGRTGGEIVWRRHGEPRMLRHIAVGLGNGHGGGTAITALGSELRRAAALGPAAGVNGSKTGNTERQLLLLDSLGLSQSDVDDLAGRVGAAIRPVAPAANLHVQIEDAAANGQAAEFAPAMALAVVGARRDITPDLAHSRLAPPPQRKVSRLTVWGIILGAAILVGIVSLLVAVRTRQSELADLKQQLNNQEMQDQLKAAQKNVDRVTYGRGYFDQRPDMIEALKQLTLAFHDNEPIYVTSFSMRENGGGLLAGKSTDQGYVLALSDRLRNNPNFIEVGKVDWRGDAGTSGQQNNNAQGRNDRDRGNREGVFSFSFIYRAAPGATTQPTTQPSSSFSTSNNNNRRSFNRRRDR